MSEATLTSTPEITTGAPLLEQVVQLNSDYKKNPDEVLAQARALAIEQALQHLLTGETARAAFEAGVRSAAAEGKTTYRITTWNLADGLKFNGRYLLDLLNKGELLGMMQDWLDEHYKTEDKQFRIFHHKVARVHNRFALVVSWDKEGFASIDEIISHNREMVGRRALAEATGVAGTPTVDTSVPNTRRSDRTPGAPRAHPRRFEGHGAPRDARPEGDFRPRRFNGPPRDGGDVRPRRFEPREPREGASGDARAPRQFPPREHREPREFRPREQREGTSGDVRPRRFEPREFRPREPREPREGDARAPREFRPREPREPREFRPREPREPREPTDGSAPSGGRNFSNFRSSRAEGHPTNEAEE